MSIEACVARVAELSAAFAPALAPPLAAPPATGGGSPGSSSSSFAAQLQAAGGPAALAGPNAAANGGDPRQAILALVRNEVGQAEMPPGSNDSARIGEYRRATKGAIVGPWCAYFTSWAAKQAGVPLGENGQGFGRVDDVYAWAQRTGRAIPAGSGEKPRPGDLIVWDEHIGIVEDVKADGSIATIEGNSSDRVSRRTHRAGSALGFVRMGPA